MSELKALLFDVDGTLADTERNGHRIAFNSAFSDAGLEWHWSEELYGRLLAVTGGKERIRHYISQYQNGFSTDKDIDEIIAELHRVKTIKFTEMLSSGRIPLRPGVRRLLEEARAGQMRLAIATTTTVDNVTALLTSTLGETSKDWFEVIAAGDIVASKKPAPDIYLWAMNQMKIGPEACLAIEDSALGAQAVKAAGIAALVITVNGYTKGESFPEDALVLNHLGEPDQHCEAMQHHLIGEDYVTLRQLNLLHQRSNNHRIINKLPAHRDE